MKIYFVNTDAKALNGTSLHDSWLTRNLLVTSGPEKFREKLSRIKPGDLVLPYVNGQGVVAVGSAVDDNVIDVTDPAQKMNPAEATEYHRKVTWLHDLRANPITTQDLVCIMNNTPRHAVQEMRKGKQAFLDHLRSLDAIPTSDQAEYRRLAAALLRVGRIERPTGNANPGTTSSAGSGYRRDARVRAWTLQRADGVCELCTEKAKFTDNYEQPYLESHHIDHLSKNGLDTPENTAAICANCHRELHFGVERLEKTEKLRVIVQAKEL